MRASSRSQVATATAPPQQDLTPAGPRALPALGAGLNADEAAGLQGAVGNEALKGMLGGGGRDVSDPADGADDGAEGGGGLPFQAQLEASFGEDLSHLDIQRGGAATPTLTALNAGGAHHDGTLYLPASAPFDVVAHEVAHALQAERFGAKSDEGVTRGDEPSEREADDAAKRAAKGEPVTIRQAPDAELSRWGLGEMWEGVKDVGSAVANGVTETAKSGAGLVGDVLSYGSNVVQNTTEGILTAAQGVGEAITADDKSFSERCLDGLGALGSGVVHTVGANLVDAVEIGAGVVDFGGDVLRGLADVGTETAELVGEQLLPMLQDGVNFTGSVIESALDSGGELLGGAVDLLGGGLSAGLTELADITAWGADTAGDLGGWMLDFVGADGMASFVRTAGDSLADFANGAGELASGLVDSFTGFFSGGIRKISGLLGDVASGATGLLSDGLGWVADGMLNVSEGVRSFLGLDEDGNSYTGHIEMRPSSENLTQQYSELGMPLTTEAWNFQNAVDGGKLQAVYDRTLLSNLDAETTEQLIQAGVFKADEVPEDWSTVDAKTLSDLSDDVERHFGGAEAFLSTMDAEAREDFQESVLDQYMAMARADEDAAFVFSLLPTEMTDSNGELGESLEDWVVDGQLPNNFAVGEDVGKARVSDVALADQLQQLQGKNTYGLVVPYANTPGNTIGRNGTPTDGSEHLNNYLNKLVDPVTGERNVTTVASGYSQGAAGVLDYVDNYGQNGLLDYAVATAPMGGADRNGGSGVFNGEWNGVQTLSVMNEQDPAQHIEGENLMELAPGMANFMDLFDVEGFAQEGDRHGAYWGQSDKNPDTVGPWELPNATPEQLDQGFNAGTFGYPTQYIQPMITDLLNDRYKGEAYDRRGGWDYDLNTLLNLDENGKPENFELPGDPRQIANDYLPR